MYCSIICCYSYVASQEIGEDNDTVFEIIVALALGSRNDCIIFYILGERLSLLVLRTAPGLGNVTVDWTIQGPLVHRTFIQTSGTVFFTEVNTSSISLSSLSCIHN